MKKMLLFLLLLVSLTAFSQNDSIQKKLLNGQIIHAETKKALSAAHILNLNTVEGTITDENGFFIINSINTGEYSVQAEKDDYLFSFEAANTGGISIFNTFAAALASSRRISEFPREAIVASQRSTITPEYP